MLDGMQHHRIRRSNSDCSIRMRVGPAVAAQVSIVRCVPVELDEQTHIDVLRVGRRAVVVLLAASADQIDTLTSGGRDAATKQRKGDEARGSIDHGGSAAAAEEGSSNVAAVASSSSRQSKAIDQQRAIHRPNTREQRSSPQQQHASRGAGGGGGGVEQHANWRRH